MKSCPHCRQQTPIETRYCIHCGLLLTATPTQNRGDDIEQRLLDADFSAANNHIPLPVPDEIGNTDVGLLLTNLPRLLSLTGCLFWFSFFSFCGYVLLFLQVMIRFSP